jgi:PIN domain nuclease of toxin-antitoxin system
MIHLLDTHVLVWMMLAPEKLGKKTRTLLEHPRSQLAASSVSLWEIEYKRQQTRIVLPEDWSDTLPEHGIDILPVSGKTALLAAQLPMHGDPFDRLIMAQAQLLPAQLVTADEKILAAWPQCLDARK